MNDHLSFQHRIDEFIESLFSEKGYSLHTKRAYHQNLLEFFEFITGKTKMEVKGIDPCMTILPEAIDTWIIRDFIQHLFKKKNKKSSIARKLSALRSFFRYLVKHGVLRKNPAEFINRPKQDQLTPHVP